MATAVSSAGVLILDDDGDLLHALSALISGLMDLPTVAVSSLAALTARRDEALACKLAILDVNLGAGSPTGIDALGWLRGQGFAGRVVFLTGHASAHPELIELNERWGILILEKPTSVEVLERIIRGAR